MEPLNKAILGLVQVASQTRATAICALLLAEFAAANGVTDARSLARMYAAVIGSGVDGIRLLNDETIRLATTEQCVGRDRVTFANTRFGLGFALHLGPVDPVNEGAFGRGGAGGSLGFADPVADIGFGYVMNKMQPYWRTPARPR